MVETLKTLLRTRVLGSNILHLDEVDSTNNVARDLAREGCGEGTLVLAEVQTAGRGREGRRWYSPRGGAWMSIVLKPKLVRAAPSLLNLAAGVAVCKAIRRQLSLEAFVKWPNDVMVQGRKVCGILAEAFTHDGEQFVILGIGINVSGSTSSYPEEFRADAISLEEATRREVDRNSIVAGVLEELEALYPRTLTDEHAASAMLDEWQRLSCMLGKRVTVEAGEAKFTGIADRVDKDGALILRRPDGSEQRILSGSVTVN